MARKYTNDLNTRYACGNQKSLTDLTLKLRIALEADLKRLYQDSRYCDLEIIVDHESLFSHSCIVKARAARFYYFLTTKCLVTHGPTITTVIINHASTNYLRKFLENLYSSEYLPEAETYVLKYLENVRKHLILGSKDRLNHRSDPNLLSPESDKFFTPKSSPSELFKPFTLLTTSEEEVSLSRSKNNASVRSYYRIVSVDDFHGEEKKLDSNRRNDTLEKELAEQDALFQSLKIISSKEKVHPSTSLARTLSRGSAKKISTPKSLHLDRDGNKRICLETKKSKRKYPVLSRLIIPKENNLMMDLSFSDPDSAVELHSPGGRYVNVKDSSRSEMSNIDNTDANKSQNYAKECPQQSPALPLVTIGDHVSIEDGISNVLIESTAAGTTATQFGVLKDEDVARLDAMERNIKDCEVFLDMERRTAIADTEAIEMENSVTKPPEPVDPVLIVNDTNGNADCIEGVVNSRLALNDTLDLNSVIGLASDYGRDMASLSTPPCSPKVPSGDAVFKHSDWVCTSSKNCFIDASSLLDEDEITSPPMSLPPIKINEVGVIESHDQTVVEVSDTSIAESNITDSSSNLDPGLERRQGELIFKNSIPHFSKHEVNMPSSSLCSGVFEDDFEQVVPVSVRAEIQQLIAEASSFESDSSNLSQSLPVTYGFIPETSVRKDSPLLMEVPNDPSELRIKAIVAPTRKISAECVPIVSGGVSPKDYTNSLSHSSSPQLPRRHEHAPILSGGMDAVEVEKPKKSTHQSGDVWVVDVGHIQKPANKLTSSESETDEKSLKNVQLLNLKEHESSKTDSSTDEEASPKPATSYPLEKCSSLGYFIDFGEEKEKLVTSAEAKKHKNDSSNFKKNMFSMFIDLSDGSSASGKFGKEGKAPKGAYCDNKGEPCNNVAESEIKKTDKKPFYMFIETDSPVVKRKTSQGGSKLPQYKGVSADDKKDLPLSLKSHKRTLSTSIPSEVRASSRYSSIESEEKYPSLRDEPTQNVWSSNEVKVGTEEYWSASNDIQVTYKDKPNDEKILKKGSTFIIEGAHEPRKHTADSCDLQTVVEATPPKSPSRSPKSTENDSGVVATEESDDSFVRLSDLDNTGKNPYMEVPRRQQSSRMSRSIPEGSWMERKPSRIPEREKIMSKSIGSGGGKQLGSASGDVTNRSLSRLFPNLSSSTLSLFRQNGSNSGGRLDAENSELSMASEFSSIYSSTDQYGLEISTSETDVSCHANGTSRLGQDLLRMFLEEISPDVVVEVGGRRIKAHKCILSSRCQFFAATLSGGWVESAGNVISLQGFSYSAVHFALCHIYSGESEIPDSLNMIELATLADILGLEGLKEVISYTLRTKYCHSFHPPCSACVIGVIDCLSVSVTYGLDELYRKCLRWITKFFVKVWPTKTFASLPKELLDKCFQYHLVHMTVDNVLDTVVSIEKMRGSLPSVRWAETVGKLANKLQDATTKFLADRFSSILTSDQFLALGKHSEWNIERVEKALVDATGKLPAEQACWSHGQLHSLLSVATSPDPPPEMVWNENFIVMLSNLSDHVQTSLIRQAPRAARSRAWQQMEPELRSRIQEAACLVLPNDTLPQTSRRFPPKKDLASSSFAGLSVKNNTRASDLRQFKLAMVQQVSKVSSTTRRQQQPIPDYRRSTDVPKTAAPPRRIEVRKSQSTSAVRETLKTQKVAPPTARLAEVKSRYLEPRSPIKVAPEKTPVSNVWKNARVSSSDSSRNCSPAMTRATNKKASQATAKPSELARRASNVSTRSETPSARALSHLTGDDNMSTDSLATESSCGEPLIAKRQLSRGKENTGGRPAPDKIIPSLPKKTQSLGAFPNTGRLQGKMKTMIPRIDLDSKAFQGRRLPAQVRGAVSKGGSLSSPRTITRIQPKANTHAMNGNVNKRATVDSENNKTMETTKPPASVSRSGTFLKDEPTILTKLQVDV